MSEDPMNAGYTLVHLGVTVSRSDLADASFVAEPYRDLMDARRWLDLRDGIATARHAAREEGRRAGLEQAANHVRDRIRVRLMYGLDPSVTLEDGIRALATLPEQTEAGQ